VQRFEISQQAAPVLAKPFVGRGSAQADYFKGEIFKHVNWVF